METRQRIVLAVTGASGSIYAVRLIKALLDADREVHLVISGAGRQVAVRELGSDFPLNESPESLWRSWITRTSVTLSTPGWGFASNEQISDLGRLQVWNIHDFSAGIASGSFLTAGMVVCPCSSGTLSAIATGASVNLIHRAADVHLKERRPLVLVPRETPLSLIQLENMTRVSQAGATVLPSMPGFYHQPGCIADLVHFVVGRICDHLRIPNSLVTRWGSTSADSE